MRSLANIYSTQSLTTRSGISPLKYLAEDLDERNLGQVLVYTRTAPRSKYDANPRHSRGMAIIQEITHHDDERFVEVVTAERIKRYRYGTEVETALSPELRMLRVIMNAITGLENTQPRTTHDTTAERIIH